MHPTPYTPHPTPYTLHPQPYTLHPTPHTLHPQPGDHLPRTRRRAAPRGTSNPQINLTESDHTVVLQESTPAQVHQLILYHYYYEQ